MSEGILDPRGLDFGSRLESKIEPQNDLKIRSAKSVKFDSRVDGSSILEVSRGSKIDEKSMKKRLQGRTSS